MLLFKIRIGENAFGVINLWDCLDFYTVESDPKLRWSEAVVYPCQMDSVFLNI